MTRHVLIFPILALSLNAAPPQMGHKAPDFELKTLSGDTIRLSQEYEKSPVVLVVLRGYPGYQCPMCMRQVQDFMSNAGQFRERGARVLFVYPGPLERAREFSSSQQMPKDFELLLDPDYSFTNLYGLRWDAPKETAYPATFLLNRQGEVMFVKISKTHGGRSRAAEVLEQLPPK